MKGPGHPFGPFREIPHYFRYYVARRPYVDLIFIFVGLTNNNKIPIMRNILWILYLNFQLFKITFDPFILRILRLSWNRSMAHRLNLSYQNTKAERNEIFKIIRYELHRVVGRSFIYNRILIAEPAVYFGNKATLSYPQYPGRTFPGYKCLFY